MCPYVDIRFILCSATKKPRCSTARSMLLIGTRGVLEDCLVGNRFWVKVVGVERQIEDPSELEQERWPPSACTIVVRSYFFSQQYTQALES